MLELFPIEIDIGLFVSALAPAVYRRLNRTAPPEEASSSGQQFWETPFTKLNSLTLKRVLWQDKAASSLALAIPGAGCRLQAVNVSVKDRDSCNRTYGGVIIENMCAGDRLGSKDSCWGDSGVLLSAETSF